MIDELRGKRQFAGHGLANPAAVEGPGEGVDDSVADGAFEFVAQVAGSHEIETVVQDGGKQVSTHSELRFSTPASRTAQALAPRRWPVCRMLRKASPRPGTPVRGGASRWTG